MITWPCALGVHGLATLLVLCACHGRVCAGPEQRPDILLIMADDLGYADLGCYGGEIQTPHLDGLASNGTRFTHFRVEPMCVVTRVALMAGRPFNAGGDPGYKQTTPFPALLKDSGYDTHLAGKWHAGNADPRGDEVFNQFYGFMGGMTDSYTGGPDWFLNQRRVTAFPDGWYATDAITDQAIRFMKQSHAQGRPTFTFVSYNAPHHPCQAPRETVEKYLDLYQEGYEAIRQKRLDRQLEMGLIDEAWPPAAHGSEARQWRELPAERQRVEAGRMAAYAATIDEIDQSVGKLLAYLKDAGKIENTLILFISDNGGDYNNGGRNIDAKQIPWLAGHNPTSSNAWAWVKNTPFRSYKHASFEGALASPLIVHWPEGLLVDPGSLIHQPTHITDLYPTFLELAGIEYPATHRGKRLAELSGSSLVPLLQNLPEMYLERGQFSWFAQSRAWTEDGWKAVQLYDGPWQLYNLTTDRGETTDLAGQDPERLQAMVNRWRAQADPAALNAKPVPGTQLRQRHWGWHRLQMICRNRLLDLKPNNSDISEGTRVRLELTFSEPIDFSDNNGKSIRLFAVSDESAPVWQASPNQTHPAQGQRRVVFESLPELEPDTAYFVEWDPGFAKVGGQPLGPLNDGAYWWRFRTPAAK
ncbi:MAG: sulfatase-like hydrolase/transferase [Planctomycetota bacterium]